MKKIFIIIYLFYNFLLLILYKDTTFFYLFITEIERDEAMNELEKWANDGNIHTFFGFLLIPTVMYAINRVAY